MVQQHRAACCAVQQLACARHSCFGQRCIRWQQACGITRELITADDLSEFPTSMQPGCLAVPAAAEHLGSSCSTAAVVAASACVHCFASNKHTCILPSHLLFCCFVFAVLGVSRDTVLL
jgi:hypothetical protein